jgi:FixJ family two-component response regulator
MMSASSIAASAIHADSLAPRVLVLDDDISVRESLKGLIEQAGWPTEVFASAQEFFARAPQVQNFCLVLDMNLQDTTGLDVQKRLGGCVDLPIIFITGGGDVPTSVRAMKNGAIEFLTKPIRPNELLDAITIAFQQSNRCIERERYLGSLRIRYASLTFREQQVMGLIVLGLMNKQVAGELAICEITVKVHRGRLMRKMGARSFAELVYMEAQLGCDTGARCSAGSGRSELAGGRDLDRFGRHF